MKKSTISWIIVIACIAILAIIGTSQLSFITTYDSPDVAITKISKGTSSLWTGYSTDVNVDAGLFDPDLNIQVSQPKTGCKLNFGTSCLIKDIVASERKLGNDKITTHIYYYESVVFYKAYSNAFGEDLLSVENYNVDFNINYKGKGTFKSATVIDHGVCSSSNRCGQIVFSPITGTSFVVANQYTEFQTHIGKMPSLTDAFQKIQIRVEYDELIKDFYINSDLPDSVTELNQERQIGTVEMFLNGLGDAINAILKLGITAGLGLILLGMLPIIIIGILLIVLVDRIFRRR